MRKATNFFLGLIQEMLFVLLDLGYFGDLHLVEQYLS